MITVIAKKFNTLHKENSNFQSIYDQLIDKEIDFFKLQCSCGHHGCLTKHAYYYRYIRTISGFVKLKILRVFCSLCHKTHAIMLHTIVPYSQILFEQHLDIVTKPISKLETLMINFNIDLSLIRYIKKQYDRHWKQRLSKHQIPLDDSLSLLCFTHFNQQFMQIRCLPNVLH
jgi:hypothetical protein